MAKRNRYGGKFGEYYSHDAKRRYMVRLHKGSGTFTIEIDERNRVSDDTLNGVENKLEAWINDNDYLDFKPYIAIEDKSHGFHDREVLRIKYDRYFLATNRAGKKVQLEWEHDPKCKCRNEEHLYDNGKKMHWHDAEKRCPNGTPRYSSHHSSDDLIIPYDHKLWLALLHITYMVDTLRDKLDELLLPHNDKGKQNKNLLPFLKSVASGGLKALPLIGEK